MHFFSSVRKLFLLFFSSLLRKEHCGNHWISFILSSNTRFIAGYHKYFQVYFITKIYLQSSSSICIIIAKVHNSLFNLNYSLILCIFSSTVYIECSKRNLSQLDLAKKMVWIPLFRWEITYQSAKVYQPEVA